MRVALFLAMLLLNTYAFADDQCTPLARVAFTNQGVAKLSSTILTQQFQLFKNKVNRISGFKQIQVRPKCDTPDGATTKCAAYKGLPILDANGAPTFGGYRPFNLDLDLKKTALDMHLARPINCVDFTCAISIQIDTLSVDGTITNFSYADTGEVIATKLKPEFDLVKPVIYNLEISINPTAPSLNQMASTNIKQHSVEMQPGSIMLNLRPISKDSTTATQTHGLATMLRAILDTYRGRMKNPAWGASQVAKFKNEFILAKMTELDKIHYPPLGLAPTCADQGTDKLRQACVKTQTAEIHASQIAAEAAYQKYFRDHHTSESQMAAQAMQTAISTTMSDDQVIAFFNHPPSTLNATELHQMLYETSFKFKAQDSGFSDLNMGNLILMADQFVQTLMPTLLDDKWTSLIEVDLKPAVTTQINYDLGIASDYWSQIDKVPNLNLQSIERKSRWTTQLSAAKAELATLDPHCAKAQSVSKEIATLQNQLTQLADYVSTDWLDADTKVLIDSTNPNRDLLKAQIYENQNACTSTPPSEFADEVDSDLITDFSLDTIREYFQKMIEYNKLSLCVGSDDPACKKGSTVVFNTPPTITCENGAFKFDFGYKAKGLSAATELAGTLGQCNGNPCFHLTSTRSDLNNSFINFFVGGILNRAVTGAVTAANGVSTPIPDVTLTSVETNPSTCATRLKWSVQNGGKQL
jgi:hypothetical protein